MGGGLRLQAGRTVMLRDTTLLQHCRRTLGPKAKNLITYYAPESGRYCVALQRGHPSGRITEIFSYRRLSEVRPSQVQLLRYFCSEQRRKADAKRVKARVAAADRKEINLRGDKAHEREDKRKHYIRKLRLTLQDHPALILPHVGHLVK